MADLLQYDRDAPAHWHRELAALTPRSDRVSWLVLAWEAGASERPNPYYTPQNGEPRLLDAQPIHRWMLYEATPPGFIPEWKREMLLEEPVETAGHRRMLEYYHASGGVLIEPWWVIQGPNGGHKYEFTDSERNLLHLQGLPFDAPAPGALPYADFDQRVIRQVMKWDRLRQGYASVKEARRRGSRDAEVAFRRELVSWLGDQVQDSIETVGPVIDDNTLPIDDSRSEPDFEALEERYIEDGVLAA